MKHKHEFLGFVVKCAELATQGRSFDNQQSWSNALEQAKREKKLLRSLKDINFDHCDVISSEIDELNDVLDGVHLTPQETRHIKTQLTALRQQFKALMLEARMIGFGLACLDFCTYLLEVNTNLEPNPVLQARGFTGKDNSRD